MSFNRYMHPENKYKVIHRVILYIIERSFTHMRFGTSNMNFFSICWQHTQQLFSISFSAHVSVFTELSYQDFLFFSVPSRKSFIDLSPKCLPISLHFLKYYDPNVFNFFLRWRQTSRNLPSSILSFSNISPRKDDYIFFSFF